jgi:hypothetical protein
MVICGNNKRYQVLLLPETGKNMGDRNKKIIKDLQLSISLI